MLPIPTQELALALFQAERQRSPIQPLSETYPSLTPAQAYAIQTDLLSLKQTAGVRVIGHKIGLTSKAMQQQLGVDQPDYGVLLDTMAVASGSTMVASDFIQARIEPEIAFWLAEDVRGPGITIEQVLAATRGVSAALELVDSRIVNWRITLVDTIADNASSARMIVSEQIISTAALDLAQIETVLSRSGQPVGTGTGAAVLGHPAAAVAWLANKLAEFGTGLRAGQVILPGAMCAAVSIAAGDTFQAAFTGLGTVSVSFR